MPQPGIIQALFPKRLNPAKAGLGMLTPVQAALFLLTQYRLFTARASGLDFVRKHLQLIGAKGALDNLWAGLFYGICSGAAKKHIVLSLKTP